MGKLILITGGARSGKSTYAEQRAFETGEKILYVATAAACDDEMKERIKRHRLRRPDSWATLEGFRDFDLTLPSALEGRDAVLLDCITNMVSGIMLQKAMDWDDLSTEAVNEAEKDVDTEVDKLLDVIRGVEVPFILVTNELGMGVVPPYALGRAVRDIAGRTNQKLARTADEVYLCVSGIPVRIK
jgi:adenosylcobinamide kinase/adenosylcobinamide-phosphate guanylyltransferase